MCLGEKAAVIFHVVIREQNCRICSNPRRATCAIIVNLLFEKVFPYDRPLKSFNSSGISSMYQVITLKCAAMSIISEMGARKQYTIALQVLRSF